MAEPTYEPNKSSQANPPGPLSSAQLDEAVSRLERALQYESGNPADHARCQAAMPDMAAAELEGRRVAQRFPFAYAHLDACEECALEYGELLDTLLALEDGSLATAEPQPPLPGRLLTAMRIRGWVERTAKQVMEHAQTSAGGVEMMIEMLLTRLHDLPPAAAPLQVQQLAMGFGGEDDETPLLLATWYATQQVAEQYSTKDLQALAKAGTLAKRAKTVAEETAQQLHLSRKLRNAFVEQFVHSLEADPAAFIQLGKPGMD